MLPPSLTVLVPAYNAAGTIARALDSLGRQTDRDFRVLVVDDRSTDDTAAIARATLARHHLYGDVLVSDRPRGPANARNVGLAHAQSDWVVFLDADDEAEPGRLAAISQTAAFAGDAWLIVHRFLALTPQGIPTSCGPDGRGLTWLDLTRGNVLATSATAIHRQAVDAVGGFDPALHGTEDWHLWLRCTRKRPVRVIPDALTVRHAQPRSVLNGRSLAEYEAEYDAFLAASAPHLSRLARRRLAREVRATVNWHASVLARQA